MVIFPASFAALKDFLLSEGHLKNWQLCEERLHFVYLCVNEQLSWTLKPHFHAETHLSHMLTVCSLASYLTPQGLIFLICNMEL